LIEVLGPGGPAASQLLRQAQNKSSLLPIEAQGILQIATDLDSMAQHAASVQAGKGFSGGLLELTVLLSAAHAVKEKSPELATLRPNYQAPRIVTLARGAC